MKHHVGIIGAGNISETHARAATAIPGMEITAVVYGHADRSRVRGGEEFTAGIKEAAEEAGLALKGLHHQLKLR